jgi:hypothetical protein
MRWERNVPHVKITVDGVAVMDGDTGDWKSSPPPLITEQLKAGAQPKPWMRALLLTVADAAVGSKAVEATVETGPRGWSLTVVEAP